MNSEDLKQLSEYLKYSPDTGEIHWIKWSGNPRVKIGDLAGQKRSDGYVRICLKRKRYMAHKVAWALFYNEPPTDYLDHINHKRDDNKIANLRIAGVVGNNRNRSLSDLNKSGKMGVHWSKRLSKWIVQFQKSHIGTYDCFFSACCIRQSLENAHGWREP